MVQFSRPTDSTRWVFIHTNKTISKSLYFVHSLNVPLTQCFVLSFSIDGWPPLHSPHSHTNVFPCRSQNLLINRKYTITFSNILNLGPFKVETQFHVSASLGFDHHLQIQGWEENVLGSKHCKYILNIKQKYFAFHYTKLARVTNGVIED
jgi:hypothetical protein